MPIHSIDYNGIDPKFPRIFGSFDAMFDTGTWYLTGTHEEICDQLMVYGQELADNKILLADLPDNDPNKAANPATNRLFWDGNGYLVSRTIEVVSVWFDGEKYCCSLRRIK